MSVSGVDELRLVVLPMDVVLFLGFLARLRAPLLGQRTPRTDEHNQLDVIVNLFVSAV